MTMRMKYLDNRLNEKLRYLDSSKANQCDALALRKLMETTSDVNMCVCDTCIVVLKWH